jgi:alanyl-tRNA synthetase
LTLLTLLTSLTALVEPGRAFYPRFNHVFYSHFTFTLHTFFSSIDDKPRSGQSSHALWHTRFLSGATNRKTSSYTETPPIMITTGKQLRQAYLEFFKNIKSHPHPIVPSSPVVPPDDPTLLFTTAGMVQFKMFYSGKVDPLPYPRATTVQKCLRAGGKGSDLENVGKTLRHHTFFEMLGNFSFGDYFKREAVRWAWKFVTEVMELPKDRLFPTIFEEDEEAGKIWKEETDCHYNAVKLDASQNFWGPAGDTGACGPCSELCFFMGTEEELAQIKKEYAEKGDAYLPELGRRIDEEGDLFLEIWNMVFPQFDQQKDGSRPQLKNRGIDTGAGLERMTTALNFVRTGKATTPYETDLMWPIVEKAARIMGVTYKKIAEPQSAEETKTRLAVNAIADHTRALVFTLAEGITPSNIGRGYVLRRIQRRALRFASLLGYKKPFMADLYDAVAETMGDAYPEILKNPDFIRKSLQKEEEMFLRTLDRGNKMLADLFDAAVKRKDNIVPGTDAFRLWDTFGFPVDLTKEIAEDAGLQVDMDGYHKAMAKQKEDARKSWKGAQVGAEINLIDAQFDAIGATEFVGYDTLGPVSSTVVAIVNANALVDTLNEGADGVLVLKQTPFYAESGGQVGDTGVMTVGDAEFLVTDTQKTPSGIVIHLGKLVSGTINKGDQAESQVDADRRTRTIRNHSSVHLLQSVLKRLLGEHITQAGSFVGPEYSRFDFSHTDGVTQKQLADIQREVNRIIIDRMPVTVETLSLEAAKEKGAIAPFGEKYGHTVRVVTMGDQSMELCGGTHVKNTGDIMHFRIVGESSIASGIRRIETITGIEAVDQELIDQYKVVTPLETSLAVKGPAVVERISTLQNKLKDLEREMSQLKQKMATSNLGQYIDQAIELDGAKLVAIRMDDLDGNQMRAVAVELRDKLGATGVVAVVGASGGKVGIVAAVGEAARKAYPAGQIVNKLAAPLGGRGGGKPDLAQGGAKDAEKINEVLAQVKELIG